MAEEEFQKYKPDYSGMDLEEVFFTNDIDYKGRNISYKMDIMRPENDVKARPVIVFVHGGGFIQPSNRKQAYISWFAKLLIEAGYAVISPDYPIYDTQADYESEGEHKAAERAAQCLHDMRCYLTNHQHALNLDLSKIILMGGSAGGMASFRAVELYPGDWDALINLWGAVETVPDVTKFPPVYSVHGTKDHLVNCKREYPIHKALDNAGILNVLQLLEGADHTPIPQIDEYLPGILQFIEENIIVGTI